MGKPCQLGGLSLCIQGTRHRPRRVEFERRFIPVYTGNSTFSLFHIALRSVYPCVYRELQFDSLFRPRYNGLSLCIQGTHVR